MFALFVIPVDFDATPAMYSWVVHKAVERLTPNIALISTDDYWNNATEIISASRTIPMNTPHEYLVSRILTVGDFDSLRKLGIDKNFFSAKYSNVSRSKSLSIFHQEFDEDLYSIACNHLEALSDIDALLMWSNCSTIQLACKKYSIQTIFNELGPLRPPNYHPAAYFDFSGLHDKSSAEDRFVRFRSCCESGNITILDRWDLIRILRANKPDCAVLGQKLTGVALQASGQFFLDYSNKFSNHCLINYAQKKFPGPMLVRSHPGLAECYRAPGLVYDKGESPEGFINNISQLITINSGIAFESLLVGKPTYMLGESPIKYGAWDLDTLSPKLSDEEQVIWLNWFAFGYLIPFQFLFNKEYYDWRLTNPSEMEIYCRNLKWWRKHGGARGIS